jgi:hypothetical protein
VNANYVGKAQYDDSFALSPQCQDKIMQVCKALRLYTNSHHTHHTTVLDNRTRLPSCCLD